MRSRLAWGLFASLVAAAVGIACGGAAQRCMGKEQCACYPNGTCDAGLSCLSNLCVNAGGQGGAGLGSGPAGNTAGASGTAGSSGAASGGTIGWGGAGIGGPLSSGGGPMSGHAGSAGTASGGSGAGGVGASGGGPGSGGIGPGLGGQSGTCRLFETVPGGGNQVPTVFMLVDRSGSMFTCANAPMSTAICADPDATIWAVLRASILQVILQHQDHVRFGFGAFTGTRVSPMMCPVFDRVPSALDNYQPIAALYNPLGPLGVKAETPVGAALERAKMALDAETSPGPKYILFVTDGEPDFCNDGFSLCAVDSVVAHLQALKTAGVTTLVFGIQNGGDTTAVPLPTLQAFANAGAGQPVSPLTATVRDTADMCQTADGWQQEAAAAALPPHTPLGTYSAVGGTAMVYKPNPADQAALGALLAGTIAGVKSCTFDLANGLSVDLAKAGDAHVAIEGMTVPRDDANGWHMVSATQLALTGTACALWRQPASRSIDFQFPCGSVVGK